MGYRYNKSQTCAFNCKRMTSDEIIGPSSPSRAHAPGPTGQLRWVASQEQLLHANDPFNMDVFWPFSSIYQPGNLHFHEIKGIPLQIRVRSVDMSDVLTIDRESLGKIQHRTTKTRIYDHLWRRIGPRLQKARWNEFSAFTLPGKGSMSKTNPNKLEQHLLFVIDQASNIARSNDQIQSQSLLNYCNHFFSCPGPGASSKEGFSFAFTILS